MALRNKASLQGADCAREEVPHAAAGGGGVEGGGVDREGGGRRGWEWTGKG